MTTLSVAVDADDKLWTVDTLPDSPFLEAGDELVAISARFPEHVYLPTTETIPAKMRVVRAQAGTAAASHLQGITLTPVYPESAAGEGGGIAATDEQIVFMDGTDAVGSSALTWDSGTSALGLADIPNSTANIRAIGAGVQLVIEAGDGDATHVGGEVHIQSGDSDGFNSGSLQLYTGFDGGGGDSGDLDIATGFATTGKSGDISIKPGQAGAGSSGVGGNVNITADTGQTGDGGDVLIQAGPKVTAGSHGTVQIYSAEGAHSLELSETAGFMFFGGVIVLDGLPTADPANAGQLYTDGAPGVGDPKALMVSGG